MFHAITYHSILCIPYNGLPKHNFTWCPLNVWPGLSCCFPRACVRRVRRRADSASHAGATPSGPPSRSVHCFIWFASMDINPWSGVSLFDTTIIISDFLWYTRAIIFFCVFHDLRRCLWNCDYHTEHKGCSKIVVVVCVAQRETVTTFISMNAGQGLGIASFGKLPRKVDFYLIMKQFLGVLIAIASAGSRRHSQPPPSRSTRAEPMSSRAAFAGHVESSFTKLLFFHHGFNLEQYLLFYKIARDTHYNTSLQYLQMFGPPE